MTTFEDSGLRPELLRAIQEMGFINPMPVQAEVIPLVLSDDRDIVALAQTGTGKTAAFGLPLIHHVDENDAHPQALILCPTRELCMQVSGDLTDYARYVKGVRYVT
jgi:ATP-dependent RNA helicase DeaD